MKFFTMTLLAALVACVPPARAQQTSPPAGAQQQPQQNLQQDPAFLQRALGAMQNQRNVALDGQAAAEARVGMLTEDVARLTAQVTALEAAAKKATDGKKE